jgi:hypothetical protein
MLAPPMMPMIRVDAGLGLILRLESFYFRPSRANLWYKLIFWVEGRLIRM